MVYLHLPKFDTDYIQKINFELEYYGIKVKFGEPTLAGVAHDFRQGRRTVVVVSNTLI